MDAAHSALEAEGWRIKPEAYRRVLEDVENTTAGAVREALLLADIRKVGRTSLPEDINRATRTNLAGPFVLQVESVRDVTKPDRGIAAGETPNRLLMLVLTDGQTKCRCIENRFCPALSTNISPGTKVLLRSAQVKSGIVLCEPKSVEVLGGRVDSLAEAWEIGRKLGHDRSKGQDEGSAPKFKHFIPGRGHRGGGKGAKAAVVQTGLATNAQEQKEFAPSKPAARPPAPADSGPSTSAADVPVSSGSVVSNQDAVKAKLLGQLVDAGGGYNRRGDGRGRGRGGRKSSGRGDRGRHSPGEEEDGHTLTLDEWEARRKVSAPRLATAAPVSDEQLARQLHAQLNAQTPPPAPGPPRSAADELAMNLFSYSDGGRSGEADGFGDHRGRGRRGGRGGRGGGGHRGGRGRGRGRGRR
eukprot:evm.model.scf_105.8 EVM.evm.TU.scf_105.8   scf_105:86719-93071(-)